MKKFLILIAVFAIVKCAEEENKVSCDISEEKDLDGNIDWMCRFTDVYITRPGFKSEKKHENITILVGQYEYKMDYLPENIGEVLPNLQSIYINRCSVKAISKLNFKGLSLLKQLKLLGNEIKTIEDGSFDDLVEVIYLYLDRNEISSLPQNIFSKLTKLEYVSMYGNKLTSLDPSLFINSPDIYNLDLSANELSTIEPKLLEPLKKLKNLEVNNNRLVDINPDLLKNAPVLEKVNFSGNNITGIPTELFVNSPALKQVNFQRNKITVIDFNIFDKNENIAWLSLSFLNLTEARNIDVIDRLKNLKVVKAYSFGEASCLNGQYEEEKITKLKEDLKSNCTLSAN